ncbi:MAG: electron transport complex subunit E [Clostridia bacterium]|nr:electron transport complex subunit E [Clostridia bacterium]
MIEDHKVSLLEVLEDGLIFNNPVFVQLLGMCPMLATSSSVKNALGMGLSATAVLICSNLAISALRKLIPEKVRIAAYIIVIAGFVTAVDLLLQAFFPELSKSLGVFIPLIVVNCIIFARAEAFASKNAVLPSAVDGLGMGLGFTFALLLLSTIREILGSGKWFGIPLFGGSFKPMTTMTTSTGGFLVLGFVIAGAQALSHSRRKGDRNA